jgi:hypothetical protein
LLAAHWGLRSAFLLSSVLLIADAVLLVLRGNRVAK